MDSCQLYSSLTVTAQRPGMNLLFFFCKILVPMAVIVMIWIYHLSDSQARCSQGLRPSLAESVLSSTYWGREDDLDTE